MARVGRAWRRGANEGGAGVVGWWRGTNLVTDDDESTADCSSVAVMRRREEGGELDAGDRVHGYGGGGAPRRSGRRAASREGERAAPAAVEGVLMIGAATARAERGRGEHVGKRWGLAPAPEPVPEPEPEPEPMRGVTA
ncbi:hypothetical protein OsJ_28647 [Oryza sativa Japonica Group]|uniref:Uncharacterized protein n=1 Tax=Oryza sativa subsp. japonica TaxID=39947 RepID=A3BWT5_ORYSJ|nr:hypothetical protein OsJ_28647 [Oryza sativa Japonica Group]